MPLLWPGYLNHHDEGKQTFRNCIAQEFCEGTRQLETTVTIDSRLQMPIEIINKAEYN